jgi:hypothetical protein
LHMPTVFLLGLFHQTFLIHSSFRTEG